ncbi:metallophosphoesterase family protein [Mastigocladopsis repens]|uniref:metallophosphoesterase family protein n=1 Tax=Mastigocladopsis repens TaxID=221287 RepID=UPI00035F3D26|nr:metallophosphoesterase [Mastigocladopsis repens]
MSHDSLYHIRTKTAITSISNRPIHQIPYLTHSPNSAGIVNRVLPILLAKVDSLPEGLEAIIATSDLQGIDPKNHRLLGHRVSEELENLAESGKIPPLQTTGVILAGDLYAQIDKRGGVGDVREVWQAFSRRFRWVAGVGGNHDSFGRTPQEIQAFQNGQGIHYLDGDLTCVDGIRIAGISGIIGKKTKPFRRAEEDFRKLVRELLNELPDILILHEGPNDVQARLMGNESIRSELTQGSNLLVICGHSHWRVPMTAMPKGVQVLNVDSRVVVMHRY